MSIIAGPTTSFKVDLLNAVHNFTSHSFYLALYDSTADLGPSTTAYTATGEVSGTGYTSGGALLSITAPTYSGTIAYIDITDATWATSTITARAGLIYNSSASNKSVMVLDFGANRSSTASSFTVTWPAPDTDNAILRL